MAPLNVDLGHAGVGAWHVTRELHQAGTWATATLGINKILHDGDPDIIDLVIGNGKEPNQFEFADEIRRIKQVSSGSRTEPLYLLMFLRRHQHQALDHGSELVRHGQRGDAAPRHTPRVPRLGGKLRPALCY